VVDALVGDERRKERRQQMVANGTGTESIEMGSGFRMEQPLRLRIVSVKHDSIALEWNRPEFEAERFEIMMRIASSERSEWHLVYEGTATHYVIPRLRPETDYLFRARYRCIYGWSPWPRALRQRTIKGDGKESGGGAKGEDHPSILSNVELEAKERELKKIQKRNRRESRKRQEEDERRRRREDAEQQRQKRAENKRKKQRAKQEAAKRKKEEEERAKQEEEERERERIKLYELALAERLQQIQIEEEEQREREREEEEERERAKRERTKMKQKEKRQRKRKRKRESKKEKEGKEEENHNANGNGNGNGGGKGSNGNGKGKGRGEWEWQRQRAWKGARCQIEAGTLCR